MSDFFYGLNRLGDQGTDSILSTLDKMGLTEIRESNLIAAMASRPELFASAIQAAVQAYTSNTAMMDEFEKQMGTQESQNAMLGNKLSNTMADFGQNLVDALQPALDLVNDLLESFNALSETDQSKVLEALGALALTGPLLTGVGKTVEAVGKISGGIQTIVTNAPTWGASLQAFFSSPTFWGVAAGAGILLLISYLDQIPSKLEGIITSAAGIEISFDEESVSKALSQIEQIQSALDILNGNAATEDARLTSESVKMGWGTTEMYNTGLAYESALASANIEQINNDYAAKILELQDKIKHSQDGAQNALWFEEIKGLETARDIDISAAQQSYSTAISDLFNGMAQQYPEAAKQLETAAKQYDLMATIQEALRFDWDAYADEAAAEADWNGLMKSMYSQAFDLGYMSESGYDTKEQLMWAVDNIFMHNAGWIDTLNERVAGDLNTAAGNLSENPLADYIATILSSDTVTENLDFSAIDGAFDGIIELLDFTQAAQKAVENGDATSFGDYLIQGLADGITNNSATAETSASTVGTATVAALGAALGVQSPSVFAIEQGMYVDLGLAQGITENVGVVTAAVQTTGAATIAAMMAVCNQVVAAGNSIVNYGSGYSMGANIGRGMAAGIRSQNGAVQAAARALANSVVSTLRSSLQIHSPSRVTYELGDNTGIGFVNGILDNRAAAEKAMGRVVGSAESVWNTAAWSDIALFAGLENEQLLQDAKDAVKISDADIRKIRDLAEREVINMFTTAEVKVEMNNRNEIKSNMDLDGIVDYLGEKVTERLEAVAEGVYA